MINIFPENMRCFVVLGTAESLNFCNLNVAATCGFPQQSTRRGSQLKVPCSEQAAGAVKSLE